jgi:hypothetical protein
MTKYQSFAAALILCFPLSLGVAAQQLWKEPPLTTTSDWTWGPGGQTMAPRPPFQFVKEKLDGTNPKVEVRDDAGILWTVKFGSEVHADTFAPRFLNAVGYAAEPTFFVPSGSIAGAHGLKRAKHYISKTGSFQSARFKLHEHRAKAERDDQPWSWVENPFVGIHELAGLKIMIMLMSNWDTKDARDGEGSNNTMIQLDGSSSSWYAVTDWGASLGKYGGFFKRDRWDWNGYRAQTAGFVQLAPDGMIRWGFRGKHDRDITADVGLEDIRWLVPYLSRITDADLRIGMIASGASAEVASEFARSIRERIVQLQRIAQSPNVQRARK